MTIIYSLEEINAIAKQILATPFLKKIITFHAPMGAGKTTLIKEIVKELGVNDNSSSPTFSLVNEYKTSQDETLYHFDLYRLNSEEEGYDIEWPEKTPNLIPMDHASITIKILTNEKREITLKN